VCIRLHNVSLPLSGAEGQVVEVQEAPLLDLAGTLARLGAASLLFSSVLVQIPQSIQCRIVVDSVSTFDPHFDI